MMMALVFLGVSLNGFPANFPKPPDEFQVTIYPVDQSAS